jgi:hypothetical protein
LRSGLVSIVVPVFNRPEPLVEAIESGLAQTYRPIEIVIVDDGSTDRTPEVAARLERAHSAEIRVVRRDNGGPGLARESGRLAASGEFLQYLDSDDLLLPRKLERQVAALRERPDCDVAYGICRETEPDGSEREPALRPSDRALDAMFPTFLASRWWNTLTPLYRAELCARAGPWSALRLEEDWEYDARIAALAPRLAFVPEVVAEVRELGAARSSRGTALDPERLRDRAQAHLSILASARAAGVSVATPELARFARELFLLARQCGAAGLGDESKRLFAAARAASTRERARALDFRLYGAFSTLFGPRAAARVAGFVERTRSTSETSTPPRRGRLLVLVDWLPPDFGAVGQYALLEARRDAEAGREVTLVGLSSTRAATTSEAVGKGRLTVVRLTARAYDRTRPLRRALWTAVTNCRLALCALHPSDEIRFSGSPPLLASWLVPLNFLLRHRLVYRITDFHPECSIAARGRSSPGLDLLLGWTRFLRRRVDRVEVLGEDARRRLAESGVRPERIEVVRLGAPVEVGPDTVPLPRPAELAGRAILLYSGNFGVAHDEGTFVEGYRRHHREGSGRVALWLNAVGAGAERVEAALRAENLPFVRSRPVPLDRLASLLVTPDAHLVTLRAPFWGYVVPSKIFGCLDSGRDLLFVGPEESDVHRLASERLPPEAYARVASGDAAGVAAALERIADRGSRR